VSYLVTGAAGFIGHHVALKLLQRGERVIALDNLNDYYSVALKMDRLARLSAFRNFSFHRLDLADFGALTHALGPEKIRKVIHLAAQAGVQHSIEHPQTCVRYNIVGHLNVLEYCRRIENLEILAYASSSAVYGANAQLPSSESHCVDSPISMYAASKRIDELMSNAYSHLYDVPQVGFRFFTVYGPWGRPDMAMWLFARAILTGDPISVFNYGKMWRDFTYIEDIINGLLMVVDDPSPAFRGRQAHRIYNIGNNKPENIIDVIGFLEAALGRQARMEMLPMQPGDVSESCADINAISADYGFQPTIDISEGIPNFVDWYLGYHSSEHHKKRA
jgi:UDP-glucuronate 4-epimerase